MADSTDRHSEDRQLLTECISGDQDAAEIFVRRFSDPVYRSIQHTLITKQITFSRQDLEDLHNTVFLQLFDSRRKKLRQYQGKNGCSLSTWLRIVTVRIVLNHYRKKGFEYMTRKHKQISIEEAPDLRGEEMEPWVAMEASEQERLLKDGIQSLSPRDRLFMRLHFEMELPLQEVAEAMDITVENAYTIKHRATKRLKSHITAQMK